MSKRPDRPDRPAPACPICKRELNQAKAAAAGSLPFCSARCKMVDLGNWLGDGYVIAGASLDNVEELDGIALADLLREPS